MRILWLNWKDWNHPNAGGAEVVLRELIQRMIDEGHSVTLLTCGYKGAVAQEKSNGVEIIRVGNNRYAHSMQALFYYLTKLRNKYDVVIEMVNTAPYFSVFFGRKSKRYLFYHQLARDVWFYETKVPVSTFGYYLFEPVATRLLGTAPIETVTVSKSTKNDLERYGFDSKRIHTISEGTEIVPLKKLNEVNKYGCPTLLSLGSIREMKQTLDQVMAFEIAKEKIPDLQLLIAGNTAGAYGDAVVGYIKKSLFAKDITVLGRVSTKRKIALMQKSHVIVQTAVKEGWGLTITEAASQGTPAVVYDSDGLRDSVRNKITGYVTKTNPPSLAMGIVELMNDGKRYEKIRRAAWSWSKEITFDRSYDDLKKVVELA